MFLVVNGISWYDHSFLGTTHAAGKKTFAAIIIKAQENVSASGAIVCILQYGVHTRVAVLHESREVRTSSQLFSRGPERWFMVGLYTQ